MKVYTREGIVVAEAESLKDIEILLALNKEKPASSFTAKRKYEKKSAYKKQYAKECDVCGKAVKGNCGLAVHKRHAHPAAQPVPITNHLTTA